ncbi:cupin [Hydrococcus rivularis NIES-593]|uniref:Cupin n=1 Tax=Hydrococcus rivularis NIES-593 TaxID=1921803 RepID=A0A1U7HTC3_9CYAN|nr:cupin [Hydrococcus rivularis]OKH26832.1 cupin [Hydrococcus rivularis NIES-593]
MSEDWLVNGNGDCVALPLDELELPQKPYRLYRFLTELEDILDTVADDRDRIRAIAPRVRKLLTSSYWLQMQFVDPPNAPGWSVHFLYEDCDFPLTVQMVAWLPGNISPIHNHATWGIVALINGEEKHRFWRRSPTLEYPNRIELVSERIFVPGDIIGFLPDTIHSVEPLGCEPTISFNLYGVTDYSQRFEFDSMTHTAKNF